MLNQKIPRVVRHHTFNAIEDCIRHPQYSVGIFVNSDTRKQLVRYEIEDFINRFYSDNEIEHKIVGYNCTDIKFTNGSIVHIFNVGDCPNWCARRYNCIIYDSDLDKEYVRYVLSPLRIRFERNMKDLSKEIKVKF